jgi:hypothetical protein
VVATKMNPERRRKAMAMARLHDEWVAKYEIDDVRYTPDGADGKNRRSPTREQEWEFVRQARELLGQDPDTGLSRADVVTPPLARTHLEAHLYMDLHPCGCGQSRFDRASSVVELADGELASRYAGDCAGCGSSREFVFRLPARSPLPVDGEIRYGEAEPSQLLDAGEWLWVADRFARAVPAEPHRLPDPDRRRALARLATAVAAMDEVLKFVPPDGTDVPPSAIWTALGGSIYAREVGRFQVARLAAVREAYRASLRLLD